jgi:hypothetical protein
MESTAMPEVPSKQSKDLPSLAFVRIEEQLTTSPFTGIGSVREQPVRVIRERRISNFFIENPYLF